ncbi:secreted RxLR effector protein 161-like [Phragmites australis]|uniref:secreted RxLR effector protein 161-like n=1 Tax=Phragmites australis TaxID=29695 RepID=UPI002D7A106D|nr:secreted RxLR effector protein 161-like [Phragmites australis]
MAGMQDCNPAHTPKEERLKLSCDSTTAEVDITQYRRIIGSLRYLVHTRPDLAFSVGYVSHFMERPTKEHMVAVKRILRYVARTLSLGCHYGRTAEARLVEYTDSDLADGVDTRSSTSSGLFFYGSSLVSWHTLKQKVVALSSCEAEYVATTIATIQAVWLARLLGNFKGRNVDTVELKIDNKSALALIQNPVFHERSKHIDVRYHFIRECQKDGRISADFVGTKDQLVDIQTKALEQVRFHELRARIGMVNINSKFTYKD